MKAQKRTTAKRSKIKKRHRRQRKRDLKKSPPKDNLEMNLRLRKKVADAEAELQEVVVEGQRLSYKQISRLMLANKGNRARAPRSQSNRHDEDVPVKDQSRRILTKEWRWAKEKRKSSQNQLHPRALLPRRKAEAMTRTKAATPKNGTSTAMSATMEATFSAVRAALRSLTFPVLASEPSLRESGTAGTASQSKPRRSKPHERQPL